LFEINPDIDISEDVFCYNGHLDIAQWLYKIKPTIIDDSHCVFLWSCKQGHLLMAQWLLEINPDIDISRDEEHVFRHTCKHGHLEVAKWLLQIKPEINVSACDEYAFCWASSNGDSEMIEWLLQINPEIDLTACDEEAFRTACKNGHPEVAAWFCRLNPLKYFAMIYNNAIISWKIKYVIEYEGSEQNGLDNILCGICYENNVTLKSAICAHSFCKPCILSMFKFYNNNCPFCRREFTKFVKIT
jgi:ankyrin repeat protein